MLLVSDRAGARRSAAYILGERSTRRCVETLASLPEHPPQLRSRGYPGRPPRRGSRGKPGPTPRRCAPSWGVQAGVPRLCRRVRARCPRHGHGALPRVRRGVPGVARKAAARWFEQPRSSRMAHERAERANPGEGWPISSALFSRPFRSPSACSGRFQQAGARGRAGRTPNAHGLAACDVEVDPRGSTAERPHSWPPIAGSVTREPWGRDQRDRRRPGRRSH
jgi:hypothetical protein